MQRRGFTLIELLVVISVVALLAAILLPVFFSVRGRARQTVCVSNLRQIGLGVGLYAQDNDDYYPWAKDHSDDTSIWNPSSNPHAPPTAQSELATMQYLPDVLASYLKNAELWHCPSDSGYTVLDVAGIALNATPTAYEKLNSSYLYRTELALNHTLYSSAVAYDMAGREHGPSDVNVLMDGSGSWHGGTLFNQKRYNELMGDGRAINQNLAQYNASWNLQLKKPTSPAP